MKKPILVVLAAALVALVFFFMPQKSDPRVSVNEKTTESASLTPALSITTSSGSFTIPIELAETQEEWEKGLSGRDSLAEDRGLLFIFDHSEKWGIWMKDMKFAIDVLWADADGNIVSVHERMAPESYPKIFTPSSQAKYVLEVPAGFISEHAVKVGDAISVIRKY